MDSKHFHDHLIDRRASQPILLTYELQKASHGSLQSRLWVYVLLNYFHEKRSFSVVELLKIF